MLLQKEELEQRAPSPGADRRVGEDGQVHYTQQVEELFIEIKKLRAELCTLQREWRLTPNARPNREGRGEAWLASMRRLRRRSEEECVSRRHRGDGEGGDPNAYGTDDELESEDIQKIRRCSPSFGAGSAAVGGRASSMSTSTVRMRRICEANSLVFRMVEAEEEYLEQLQLMVSCFLRPFKMAASSQKPPCSHDEVNSIFLNAETVMFLHQIFLKGLSARMTAGRRSWLAECKQREKFASMLRRLEEKPVTQVPRYIITLHELLAHTPHNHVERKSLENARMKLEELSRQMHDEVSETENIRNNLAIERIIVGGCDILLDVNQGSVLQVLSSSSTGGEGGGGGGGGAASRFKSARARLGGSFRGTRARPSASVTIFSHHMLLCTRTSGGKLTLIEIIIDAKMGPPMTIHLVAPTLQEKTAWISDISQFGCVDEEVKK
ncbi:Ras protein-specific guanine nucleotide-releasing factor, partial [Tyrophagus putrescentiae]